MIEFVKLIDPIFDSATDFDKGYATVKNVMYVDSQGQSTQREYAEKTKEEEKALGLDMNLYNLEDVEQFEKSIIFENEDQLNYHIYTENNKYGFKDSTGEIIVEAKFDGANDYVNGFAKVGLKKEYGAGRSFVYWGLIDTTGELVLPCIYNQLGNVYYGKLWYKEMVRVSYMHYNFSDYVQREYTLPKYGYLGLKS